VTDIADRLLGEIDRIVEAAAAAPIDVVGNVLRAIKPLDATDIRDRRAASGRILIVDDNASNRDLLSRRLAREGYRVITAEDAAAAFARIAGEVFDLVLLDLMMPGISGFEALCRLKSEENTRHIPVTDLFGAARGSGKADRHRSAGAARCASRARLPTGSSTPALRSRAILPLLVC
jgi:adenylate cyclase